MLRKDDILQELGELKSSLVDYQANVYQVPVGYFDSLATTVLGRIKAMESKDAREELEHLSPFLNSVSRKMPYTIPSGYFEDIDTSFVMVDDKDELKSLSPLLDSLDKKNPYQVPAGYFDQLAGPVTKIKVAPAKILRFTSRPFFKYAAAAVVTGFIILAAFLYFNRPEQRSERIMAKIEKDIKQMNETEKETLREFIDGGIVGDETAQGTTVNKSVIKQILEEIPEEELKSFEEQTEDLEEVLMIN
jgi:hypothetical protein